MSTTTGTTTNTRATRTSDLMPVFGAIHSGPYRLSRGKLGGRVGSMPILLLTTTGRKTGQPRTAPVGYVADGDRLIVVASALGAAAHPDWYLNLRSQPRVTAQVGEATRALVAETAAGDERARLWFSLVRDHRFFEDHQRRPAREIPVVILRPAP